jgi:uncharacterized RDD family membrane protein YckC
MDLAGQPAPAERVGFGPRLGAYLIDAVVTLGIAAVTARPLSGLFPHALDMVRTRAAITDPRMAERVGAFAETAARVAIAATIVTVVYFLAEGLLGRALGKLILGLRIAGVDGRPAPVGALLARMVVKNSGNWLKLVSLVTGVAVLDRGANLVGVVILGGCFLALWPRRQALHDLAAKTAVYHASDVTAAPPPPS